MIYDSRPSLNAKANKLKGGGYEDCGPDKNYSNCRLQFCDIDNIHVVRDAFDKVFTLCYKKNDPSSKSPAYFWHTTLDSTMHRQVLSRILIATNDVLRSMNRDNENVVIHCSDGWDRTSQMCALAQLMLDPYYRTFKGFQVLIEKDWLSFGHMFGKRYGQNSAVDTGNRSPIFLQWLDCVHQVWNQMPDQFEFN